MSINKPITVARQEYIDAIIDLVNSYNLPAFVKKDALDDIVTALQNVAIKEYQSDRAAYDKACAEEAAKTETTSEDDK